VIKKEYQNLTFSSHTAKIEEHIEVGLTTYAKAKDIKVRSPLNNSFRLPMNSVFLN
jgi:hypothetical protein